MTTRQGGGLVSASSGSGERVEQLLRQVSPDRFDTYEALLHALADGQLWMLLWQGTSGSHDAQYGNMDVDGYGYAPCVTSPQELAASGWTRAHEVVTGRRVAATLFRQRWGVWLNPHAPGGGVGIPWLDLRRIATGIDQVPAGPLRISEPTLELPQFYALLAQNAHRTPNIRALRRAWVQPALGPPYLAIGHDLYEDGDRAAEDVRLMVRQSVGAVPDGLAVSSVAMADDYDPVAMWLRANSRPFFDRDAHAGAAPGGVTGGGAASAQGYPRVY
ncbi:enhanced serine sensitivity protein SseB [Streptomyces sp. RKND-216]|uniref:enhanced serine sensitivity protein SseB C-terminal domain-containing protein n=1 Tax=Streptomyces sp. RKND-216 TaxID=2562581 RepID=UPI00109DAA14|nr:enhanced serine sensitivity protein SseB C-terminal domain-containing protein [Streptomyces sp. RKND-216]THA24373.1 enhanced serine sensitivity protein SseB [Streptomyces sp. RKND-216]